MTMVRLQIGDPWTTLPFSLADSGAIHCIASAVPKDVQDAAELAHNFQSLCFAGLLAIGSDI